MNNLCHIVRFFWPWPLQQCANWEWLPISSLQHHVAFPAREYPAENRSDPARHPFFLTAVNFRQTIQSWLCIISVTRHNLDMRFENNSRGLQTARRPALTIP